MSKFHQVFTRSWQFPRSESPRAVSQPLMENRAFFVRDGDGEWVGERLTFGQREGGEVNITNLSP